MKQNVYYSWYNNSNKINKYNAMYGHGFNFKEDAFIVFIILGASK